MDLKADKSKGINEIQAFLGSIQEMLQWHPVMKKQAVKMEPAMHYHQDSVPPYHINLRCYYAMKQIYSAQQLTSKQPGEPSTQRGAVHELTGRGTQVPFTGKESNTSTSCSGTSHKKKHFLVITCACDITETAQPLLKVAAWATQHSQVPPCTIKRHITFVLYIALYHCVYHLI